MHEYYHREGVTDLSKMREDAMNRLHGKAHFRGSHEESIIHLHPARTMAPIPGDIVSCEGRDHEYFRTPEGAPWLATS